MQSRLHQFLRLHHQVYFFAQFCKTLYKMRQLHRHSIDGDFSFSLKLISQTDTQVTYTHTEMQRHMFLYTPETLKLAARFDTKL